MEERLGEMRKGRRERMRKGAIVSSSPQGMTSWSSSIKIWFFQRIEKGSTERIEIERKETKGN